MIDRVHRFIYVGSVTIVVTSLIATIMGRYFFDNFRNFPQMRNIVGPLMFIGPFAPIGTLFGTLKEGQSTGKKTAVIVLTGLSVILLLLFIWGVEYAAAMD